MREISLFLSCFHFTTADSGTGADSAIESVAVDCNVRPGRGFLQAERSKDSLNCRSRPGRYFLSRSAVFAAGVCMAMQL